MTGSIYFIDDIKQQISQLKTDIQNTEDPQKLDQYEDKFKHLINKKQEEIAKIRKKHKIKVEGDRVPPPVLSFDNAQKLLHFDKAIFKRIKEEIKFDTPTPVQMQTIPII